jgi:hypothetical protein
MGDNKGRFDTQDDNEDKYVIGLKLHDDDEDGGDASSEDPEPEDDQPTGHAAKVAQNRVVATETTGSPVHRNPYDAGSYAVRRHFGGRVGVEAMTEGL